MFKFLKNSLFKVISFQVIILFSTPVFAQPAPTLCFSVADGDFNDDNTWNCDGSVGTDSPAKSTNVTITNDVVLNVSFTGGGKTSGNWDIQDGASLIGAGFSLEFGGGVSTVDGTLEIFNLSINNGAEVAFGSTSDVTINGDFTNDNNSDEVSVNTDNFAVTGDLNNGNGGTIAGTGNIDVSGTVNNDAGGTIFACTGAGCCAGGCVLVVELAEFYVTEVDGQVILQWKTQSEVNNSHFIIEKSKDGNVFSEINQVSGAGNSYEEFAYSFADDELNTANVYYRLSDVGYDGVRTYHGIREVGKAMSSGEGDFIILGQGRFFSSKNKSDEKSELIVSDSYGKILINETVPMGAEVMMDKSILKQVFLSSYYARRRRRSNQKDID